VQALSGVALRRRHRRGSREKGQLKLRARRARERYAQALNADDDLPRTTCRPRSALKPRPRTSPVRSRSRRTASRHGRTAPQIDEALEYCTRLRDAIAVSVDEANTVEVRARLRSVLESCALDAVGGDLYGAFRLPDTDVGLPPRAALVVHDTCGSATSARTPPLVHDGKPNRRPL